MTDKYVLKGHEAVPCEDLVEWAKQFETVERHVAKTSVGPSWVSTVFLGLNHQYGEGPPLIFETMIFGGPLDQYQERCSTWEQAEAQHAEAVRLVKESEKWKT